MKGATKRGDNTPKRSTRFSTTPAAVVAKKPSPRAGSRPRAMSSSAALSSNRAFVRRNTAALRSKSQMYDDLRKTALSTRRPSEAKPTHPNVVVHEARSSEEIDSYRNQYTNRLQQKKMLVSTTRSEPGFSSQAAAMRPSPVELQFARSKFSGLAMDFKVSREDLDLGSFLTPRKEEQPEANSQLPGPSSHQQAFEAEKASEPVEEQAVGQGAKKQTPPPPPVPKFEEGGNHASNKENAGQQQEGVGQGEEDKPRDQMSFYERIEAIKQQRRQSESEYRRLSHSIDENLAEMRGSL